MAIDQFQLLLQLCIALAVLVASGTIGMKVHRVLTKARGTYGNGLPERRKRKRLVLPDPATITPRIVPPGTSM
jgi:hypothetical protein